MKINYYIIFQWAGVILLFGGLFAAYFTNYPKCESLVFILLGVCFILLSQILFTRSETNKLEAELKELKEEKI